MRMRTGIVLMAMTALVAACSGGQSLSVVFSHPQGAGVLPFVASGAAVDEELVCSEGTQTVLRLENDAGEEITEAEWAVMFDTALADGGIAEMIVHQAWTCGDESGTFALDHRNTFDFATFEFEGRQEVGSWEISSGTGSYAELAGSGSVVLDWDAETVIYEGEVE